MPKGYWIAHVKITNPERYKDYVAANAAPLKKYGARFLVRSGDNEVVRGGLGGRRHVVIEFDSYATAKACHEFPGIPGGRQDPRRGLDRRLRHHRGLRGLTLLPEHIGGVKRRALLPGACS